MSHDAFRHFRFSCIGGPMMRYEIAIEDRPYVLKFAQICVCGHGGMSHLNGGKCHAVELLATTPASYKRCTCDRETFA